MGRSLGIPSRVAVGFLRPDQIAKDTYVYSSRDLHAWPEMYFGGIGWVRFEPTPQRATTVPSYTTQKVPAPDPSQSSSAPAAAPSLNRIDRSVDPTTGARTKSTKPLVARPAFLAPFGIVLLVVVLLFTPRTLRTVVRRRRWARADGAAEVVEAGWSEVRDTAVDLRVAFDDRATVRTSAAALLHAFGRPGDEDDALGRATHRGADADPEATQALRRLVDLVERARYARRLPAGEVTVEGVRADVDRCVQSLRAGAGKRRRTRATWLPASLSAPAQARGTGRRGSSMLEPGVDRAV
jgi:hypothetical protein